MRSLPKLLDSKSLIQGFLAHRSPVGEPRGEDNIAELSRKEGINQNLYYRWSKEFLEAGKKRLAGDTAREATSDEVKELKAEARQLKETLAEVLIENRLLKKSVLGDGEDAS
jgi:transposase